MLTPSAGIIRTAEVMRCTECGHDLANVTRYPGPITWRCRNGACRLSHLPRVEVDRAPTNRTGS